MGNQDKMLNLRVDLLVESMSKSDKKDVEKMIKRALVDHSSKQKKEIEKMILDHMAKPKVKKMVSEIVEKELAAGLKSKDHKEHVVDIAKRVLVKLYRELAYNYSPVIDRIKL